MPGGAPVTERWTREIGADEYALDAVTAVKKAEVLIKQAKRDKFGSTGYTD